MTSYARTGDEIFLEQIRKIKDGGADVQITTQEDGGVDVRRFVTISWNTHNRDGRLL